MEGELRLKLLGGCELTLADEPLAKLFVKHEAFLAFLAVSGQQHSRQMIAGLLWGGKTDKDALRNLRVNLTKVRQAVGDHLIVDRQSIGFNKESRYWLDVEAFEDYIARSRLANGRFDHTLLREAVALYQGDFMAEFELRDAAEFEEWMLGQRARLQPMLIQALDQLVEHCVDEENYDEGIAYAYRLLEIEPWREETHQQLMWLLALDGQHSAALAQFEECRAILQEALGVEPLPETTQLYADIQTMRQKQTMRQTRPLPPLPEPETAVPFLAPSPVAYFLGRAAEIDQLWQNMSRENGQQRFVISGMGGVGKTSLAIQFAHTLQDEFPDGVLWVNAAGSDPMQIAEAWAAAYDYDFSQIADAESRFASLRQLLSQKRALLIFDDLVEASRIRPLLPTEGDCIMLFTTRNANLAPVLAASRLALRELSEGNGRLLLAQLVGQERITAESNAADTISELLQNLPLALTIAGRYLALRPRRRLADFAARLHSQGERLAALQLDDLAVRLSFMISWQALDNTQQQIFRYLGVFAGRAFTASALAAVAELQPFPAEDRLHSLVLLSLLNEEGEQHYRQHPLLADFAQEQLGDDEVAHLRMASYFLRFAQTHAKNYVALSPEWQNIDAGIEAAHRLQQWQGIIEYTNALHQAWFARGRYTQARQAFQWATSAALALEDEQALSHALLHHACVCIEQSDYELAEDLLQRSLQLSKAEGKLEDVATCQYHLARISVAKSEHDKALQLLEASRKQSALLEDREGEARTVYTRARVEFDRGRFVVAQDLGEMALAIQREVDDKLGILRTLRLLVNALLGLEKADNYTIAEEYCSEAMVLSNQLEDKAERAMVFFAYAHLHRAMKNLDLAGNYARESFELLEKMGDRRSQAIVLFKMSQIALDNQEYALAKSTGHQSLAICEALKNEMGYAFVSEHLGDVYIHEGNDKEAEGLWKRALEIATNLNNQALIDSLQKRLGKK